MAENTTRSGVYMPVATKNWFAEQSERTNIKPNQLMLDALHEYMEKHTKSGQVKQSAFEKQVLAVLKKHGVSMQR